MASEIKSTETGSSPSHLNLQNSAKDYSLNGSSDPQDGILNTLKNFIVIQNDMTVSSLEIQRLPIIEIKKL